MSTCIERGFHRDIRGTVLTIYQKNRPYDIADFDNLGDRYFGVTAALTSVLSPRLLYII